MRGTAPVSRALTVVLAAAALIAPVQLASVDTTGLVAAYGFEETSGTTALDASGNGNSGTLAGAVSSASGHSGRAMSFDGVNDVVTVADSDTLDASTALTIEAWLYPQSTGWRTALLKESAGGLAYALYASTNNSLPSLEIQASATTELRGATSLPTNRWSHLTATYDGATMRVYINGVLSSSRAASGPITSSSGALRIGGNSIWGEYFRGRIDEVRIYRRTLTAAEITLDMLAPVVVSDTTPPAAPGNLTAAPSGANVSLGWNMATDDVGVAGYRVYRDGALIATLLGADRTSYGDPSRPPGSYVYTVQAFDAAGNSSAASNTATANVGGPDDGTPTAPDNVTATIISGDDVHLTWDGSTDDLGVTTYQLYRDGELIKSRGATSPREYDDVDRPVGTHRYWVFAVDAAGHRSPASNAATAIVAPDTTAPTASFPGACDGSQVFSENVQLRPTLTEDRGPITARIELDGETVYGPSTWMSGGPYPTFPGVLSFDWRTRETTNGLHTLTVVAHDGAGNQTVSVPCQVTVDNPVLTIPITSVSDGDTVSGTVQLSAQPYRDGVPVNGGKVSFVGFSIDGLGMGIDGTAPYEASWDTTQVANGVHTIEAKLTWSEYTGPAVTTTIQVVVDNQPPADTTPPTAAITGYCGGLVSGEIEIRAAATDDKPGVTIELRVDGVKVSGPWPTSLQYFWNTNSVADGPHSMTAVARDAAGNETTSAACAWDVLNDPPPAPAGLAATVSVDDVHLAWEAGSGATSYRVHRGDSADFAPTTANRIWTGSTPSYDDGNRPVGTTHYKVVAVGPTGVTSDASATSATVEADTTPPAITLQAACGGGNISEYAGPIQGTATDDRGGSVTVEARIDGERFWGPVSTSGAFSFSWDTRQHADGPHLMTVVGRDAAGNERVFECPWTVDNRELTVPVSVTASPASGTVTVRFQPRADGAAVSAPVQLRLDGNLVANTSSGPYEYTWDTTLLPNGVHTFEARMFWLPYPSPLATATLDVTVNNAPPPAPTGLVAAYGFEETTGTTVTDSSPLGATGTISGATPQRRRPLRTCAVLRRRQRPRQRPGRELARPHHRHDAVGVGPAHRARQLADRAAQDPPRRTHLRALRQHRHQPPLRRHPDHRRTGRARHRGAGAQHVDAPRGDLRRNQRPPLRQRHPRLHTRRRRRHRCLQRRAADRRKHRLVRVVQGPDRRGPRLPARPRRRRDPGRPRPSGGAGHVSG